MEKQLKTILDRLDGYLQPWVLYCLEPHEVLNLGWIFFGETDEDMVKLEQTMEIPFDENNLTP